VAFDTLFCAPDKRFMAADSFIETANPPGSSIGEDNFFPLAKRSKDRCKRAWFTARCEPARKAAVLVDMFSGMVCISYGCSPNGILADEVALLKILAERRAMIKV